MNNESTTPPDKIEVPVKEVTIIVNTEEKTVGIREKLTFDKLIHLAFEYPPTGEFIHWTITYRHGPQDNEKGSLVEGDFVWSREGLIFNVSYTDKS